MRSHPQAAPVRSTASKVLASLVAIVALLALSASAALADDPPVLTIDPASEVGVTAAKLSGTVNPSGGPSATYWSFEVAPSDEPEAWNYVGGGEVPNPESEGTDPIAVSVSAEGLQPEREYVFRLTATNGEGANYVETEAPRPSFTTLPATAPTLTVDPASSVSYTAAHLSGTLDPEGGNVNPTSGPTPIYWSLQYSTDGESWSTGAEGEVSGPEAEGDDPITIEGDVSGLAHAEGYELRAFAYYASMHREASTPEPNPQFTTLDVAKPLLTLEAASAITATTAHFGGSVNPNAPKPNAELSDEEKGVFETTWSFECVPACAITPGATIAADNQAQAVQADASALKPNTTYQVKLSASNLGGSTLALGSFKTAPAAPAAKTLPAAEVEDQAAVLQARINPHSQPTDYFFEFGTTTAYGRDVPATPASAGEGDAHKLLTEALTGLAPGTTYHYRVVAANPTGATAGDDVAFTTLGAPCPNAARRAEQNAEYLPDCRAYEMVSPPDKNGTDVAANYMSTRASADGNSVSFISTGAWDTPGTGQAGYSTYIYDRGAGSWGGGGVNVYQDSNLANGIGWNNIYPGLSEELSAGVLLAREPHPAPGGTPGSSNFFTWQRATNSFTAATPNLSGVPISENTTLPTYAGATPDFEQIVYESELNLTPEATGFQPKAYHWDGETLHFVGILPGPGEVPAANPVIGNGRITPTLNPISDDGSKVFFTDRVASSDGETGRGAAGPIYMRIDNTETILLNEEENSAETVPLGNAQFLRATEDGSKAYFLSEQRLVAADTDVEGSAGRDLYAYDATLSPDAQNLTLVSDPAALPGDGHGVLGLLGTSADGSRVYFATRGEGYDGSLAKPMEIYVSDAGEVGHVASIGGFGETERQPDEDNYSPAGLGGELADVSDDGRFLFFMSVRQQSGDYDNAGYQQIYRYDLAENEVACASCDPGAGQATGRATPWMLAVLTPYAVADERALSADGSKVFFHSDDSLVPRDTNEARDAYVYDAVTGRVSLLSSGKSPSPSLFAAAGKDGKTAFILTRERLVTSDKDDLRDVYAVRVNGGFREPPPPTPCEGVSCLGPPSSQPPADRSATGSFSGPGNQRLANCEKQKKKAAKATRKAKKAAKQTKQARKLNAKAKQLKEKARKCSAR